VLIFARIHIECWEKGWRRR